MKKLFAGLLCIAMLLTLAACNDDAEGTPYVPPTQANSTTVPSSEPDNDEPPVPDDTPVTVWLATDSVIYDENGEATEICQVEYDERGNQISLQEKIYYDTWEIYTTLSTYDDNNLLIKEVYSGEYFTSSYIYEYDDNGNILRMDMLDEYDNPDGYYLYTYDPNGRPISYVGYNGAGQEDYRVDYVYNSDGKRAKTTIYFDGELYSSNSYEYDENGNRILIISLNEDNEETDRTEYVYDENGNKVETIDYSSGTEYLRTKYLYDSDGKILKESRNESIGDTGYTEYTYDENGNLTEVVTVYNGEIIEKAVISYTEITVLPQRAEEIKNAQSTLIHVYLS